MSYLVLAYFALGSWLAYDRNMHVALLADTAWIADELAMFKFLVVGLMDEQVRVAQVVPLQMADRQASTFVDLVAWRDTRFEWIRRQRLGSLAFALQELRIQVVHALDGRLWQGALRLADRLGVPALLSATSYQDGARAKTIRRQLASNRAVFAAATEPLAESIRQRQIDPAMVHVVPLGAHIPAQQDRRDNPSTLCVVITGNGVFDSQYQALLESLAELVREHPEMLLFLDSQGADEHQLWQAVRRYGLLSHMSMIPNHVSHRELLMGAHVLIQPQSLGRARGLTLQAMAYGLPVLARQDPWLDYLVDNQTAWITEQADADTWIALIRRTVENRQDARRLGESARNWIREHHLAADQVERTLTLYRQLVGETYKFKPQGG